MTLVIIMFSALLVLMATGMPIAAALGVVGGGALLLVDFDLYTALGHVVWNTSSGFTLTAIPLFIFMGEVIQRAGIGGRFYRASSLWLRWLPGGLLHSNVLACAVFAAISGSSIATAATIGATAIPDLRKLKYDHKIVGGSLAAGGTLGILIPPSIPMIVYGSLCNVSIGKLFVAGILPGLMLASLFSTYILVRALANPGLAPRIRADEQITLGELFASLKDVIPLLLIVVLTVASLYLGWATPTEVAAFGAAAAMVVAASYRMLSIEVLRDALGSAVRFSAMIMFVVTGAGLFSLAIFQHGLGQEVTTFVTEQEISPYAVLAALVLMYFIMGMFIDALSMMVLTIGLVFPVVTALGFDGVWFGVVLVILMEIGAITPPVGITMYTVQSMMPDAAPMDVARGSAPFVVIMLIAILLLTLFPEIALWLPRSMF